MRILHTSDWHVGRRFQGHSTLDHLELVLGALAAEVAARHVDVVVVAGDVFDTAAPSAEAYAVLRRALSGITASGAQVIITSGNHDSAPRLGYLAEFTSASGLHFLTDVEQLARPVIIDDEHGPVHFFGIPFLEPVLIRHLAADQAIANQQTAIDWAMQQINAAIPPGARSVVISHTFAANLGAASNAVDPQDAPRDFTAGGVDVVSTKVFDGITYVALGHLHGRQELAPHIRYAGAPLYYSFGEVGRRRGAWLVDLGKAGLSQVEWVDLPIPRPISQLVGNLEYLLTDGEYKNAEQHWVKAILTDNTRPVEAMRRLQTRFPYCVELVHQPAQTYSPTESTYAGLVKSLTDQQIAEEFLKHVRNGETATNAEIALLSQAVAHFGIEART